MKYNQRKLRKKRCRKTETQKIIQNINQLQFWKQVTHLSRHFVICSIAILDFFRITPWNWIFYRVVCCRGSTLIIHFVSLSTNLSFNGQTQRCIPVKRIFTSGGGQLITQTQSRVSLHFNVKFKSRVRRAFCTVILQIPRDHKNIGNLRLKERLAALKCVFHGNHGRR